MEIRPISYNDVLCRPDLLAEYSAECSIPEIGETNPQADLYARMEATGLMRMWGAIDNGSLIGFASLLVHPLPHYGKVIANIESLFVARGHRKSGAWPALRATIKAYAKEQGCVVLLYNAPAGSRLETLLSHETTCRRTNSVFTEKL